MIINYYQKMNEFDLIRIKGYYFVYIITIYIEKTMTLSSFSVLIK